MYNTRRDTPDLSNVGYNDKEEMFKILTDEDGSRYYDLTDDIIIDSESIDPSTYDFHEVTKGETPYSISYKYYGTTELWWALLAFNDIENPFHVSKNIGSVIKIPNTQLISEIVSALKYK